ncbi:O-antigen ligase family protein [Aliidiomarina maris]|uniref:O-antigen ligase-like membrane protein n=1 Tax=Aliidiomarina maris TaxID=531312 RepID=A0A327WWG6_9GAMM|nr:O-antigen ligase family protein [Aliidiomarina maris]RAJ93630.1 O-antigen ligase-like membrane protein [Aliidiomarina maris]RUO19081.1 hypothetical protein CWE07_13305 [Aliidiomarina maris]
MSKIRSILNLPIWVILFAGFIPIDMLNGVLIRGGGPSVSFAFKLIVLGIVCIHLIRSRYRVLTIFCIATVFFYLALHTLILKDIRSAMVGIDFWIKFTSIILFFLFFSLKVQSHKCEYIITIAKAAFFFLFLNTIIGLLGLGFPMYSSGGVGIGTRGLIFAGNELGGALLASSFILLVHYFSQGKIKYFTIISLCSLIMSASMTSKVSILGILILVSLIPLVYMFNTSRGLILEKKAFYFNFAAFGFFPVVVSIFAYIALYKSGLFDRIVHLNESGIMMALLSARDIWAREAMQAYLEVFSFYQILFGMGFEWFEYISQNKSVEIDPIDFLLSYGIFGLFLSYFFFLWVIVFSILFNSNGWSNYVGFFCFLLVCVSFTSGHILYSGTAGFLFAAAFSLVYSRKEASFEKNATHI